MFKPDDQEQLKEFKLAYEHLDSMLSSKYTRAESIRGSTENLMASAQWALGLLVELNNHQGKL